MIKNSYNRILKREPKEQHLNTESKSCSNYKYLLCKQKVNKI